MLRKILQGLIDKQEHMLGASLDWMRQVLNVSTTAFLKFLLVAPVANHRKRLPKEAWHLARLLATRHEGCGTCVQIVVNLAHRDGVSAQLLRDMLQNRALAEDLREVRDFTQLVLERRENPQLRSSLQKRYGEDGLVELSYAIALSRVIPTIKRALGHATNCAIIEVKAG